MNTLTHKSIAVCASLKTVSGRGRIPGADRSLSFAESILDKYRNLLPADMAAAMMVFLNAHADETQQEKKRRENILLALRLVFVKYLAEADGSRPITVNNTFADYHRTASLLVNEHMRVENPRYYQAALLFERQLAGKPDPETAAAAILRYLHTDSSTAERYFLQDSERILIAQTAEDAGIPLRRTAAADPALLPESGAPSVFSDFIFRRETHTDIADAQNMPARTETTRTETVQTEIRHTDTVRSDSSRTETELIHTAVSHTDSVHTDSTHTDTVRSNSSRVETELIHTAVSSTDAVRTDSAHTDTVRSDSSRTETELIHTAVSRSDSVHTDSAHTDTVRSDSSRVETELVHTTDSRTDAVHTDSAHTDTVRSDSSRVETHLSRETHAETASGTRNAAAASGRMPASPDSAADPASSRMAMQEFSLTLHSITGYGASYMQDTFRRVSHKRFSTATYISRVYENARTRLSAADSSLMRTLRILTATAAPGSAEGAILTRSAAVIYRRRHASGAPDTAAMLAAMSPEERLETLLLVHSTVTGPDISGGNIPVPNPAQRSRTEGIPHRETELLYALTRDHSLEILKSAVKTHTDLRTHAERITQTETHVRTQSPAEERRGTSARSPETQNLFSADKADAPAKETADSPLFTALTQFILQPDKPQTASAPAQILPRALFPTDISAGAAPDVFPVIHTVKPAHAFASLAFSRAHGAVGIYPALRSADSWHITLQSAAAYALHTPSAQIITGDSAARFLTLSTPAVSVRGTDIHTLHLLTGSDSAPAQAGVGAVIRYLTRTAASAASDPFSLQLTDQISVITVDKNRLTAVTAPSGALTVYRTAERILRESARTLERQNTETVRTVIRLAAEKGIPLPSAAGKTEPGFLKALSAQMLTLPAPASAEEIRVSEILHRDALMRVRQDHFTESRIRTGEAAPPAHFTERILREVREIRDARTAESAAQNPPLSRDNRPQAESAQITLTQTLTRLAQPFTVTRTAGITRLLRLRETAGSGAAQSIILPGGETESVRTERTETVFRTAESADARQDAAQPAGITAPPAALTQIARLFSHTDGDSVRYGDTAVHAAPVSQTYTENTVRTHTKNTFRIYEDNTSRSYTQNSFMNTVLHSGMRISRLENNTFLRGNSAPAGMILNTRMTDRYFRPDAPRIPGTPHLTGERRIHIISPDKIHLRTSAPAGISVPGSPGSAADENARPAENIPALYAQDAAMSYRRENPPAPAQSAPASSDSVTKEELISRFGNLIDDVTVNPREAASGSLSVFGEDPRDKTEQILRETAEKIARNTAQIGELEKKQAVLEEDIRRRSDTRRLCDEVMQKLKKQIQLEKSRYMG